MYKTYDKTSLIRELQTYLQEIGVVENYVAPSGIYDEVTETAFKEYKKTRGLEESNSIDRQSFELLFYEYKSKIESRNIDDNLGQNNIFPFKVGDYGEYVADFIVLLRKILESFGRSHFLRDSRLYSSYTEEAVKEARMIFGMREGAADQALYSRLLKEIKAIEALKNFKTFV